MSIQSVNSPRVPAGTRNQHSGQVSPTASSTPSTAAIQNIGFRQRNCFGQQGIFFHRGKIVSKETPESDPRQRTDWGSNKQTDEPWKGNPEKEQRNDAQPDLERWQKSSTH